MGTGSFRVKRTCTDKLSNVKLSWAHSQHPARNASTTLEHRYIYVDIDRCVLLPIETFANEASMYISLCARACYASRTGCWERAQDSWTLPVSEVKNYINTVQFLAQTDRFVSYVSSRAARFNLNFCVHVFFLLSKILCPLTCIIWPTDYSGLS